MKIVCSPNINLAEPCEITAEICICMADSRPATCAMPPPRLFVENIGKKIANSTSANHDERLCNAHRAVWRRRRNKSKRRKKKNTNINLGKTTNSIATPFSSACSDNAACPTALADLQKWPASACSVLAMHEACLCCAP